MSDKIIISCEQCRRSIRVPTDRGSIKVQCPHCQAIFILTHDIMIIKKKCLNCGYVRQMEENDKYEIVPKTECPSCGAIYEKVEEDLKEKERQEKERKKQEEIELRGQQERYRKDLEERNHQSPIKCWCTTMEARGTKLDDRINKYSMYIWMSVIIVGMIILGFWSDISFTKGWDHIDWTIKGILGW